MAFSLAQSGGECDLCPLATHNKLNPVAQLPVELF